MRGEFLIFIHIWFNFQPTERNWYLWYEHSGWKSNDGKKSFENYACHLQNKLTAQCWRSMRIGEIASKEIERGRGDKERDSVRIRLVKILT